MTSCNIFNQENDAHLFFSTQLDPSLYSHAVSVEGETKKRRRRKNKGESGGDLRKRRLTNEQVNGLEYNFNIDHNLETHRKEKIAAELGLDPQQVAIWFQNRRVRWRVKKLEEEYKKLKAKHESVIVEKSCLEAEVVNLRAQLSEAGNEIKMLAERSNGVSSSQDSSFCMDMDQHFLGDVGMGGFDEVFYPYEYSYLHGMECVNNVYDLWV